jgi:uncharacterized protein involved in outer membrane biogenesis
MIYKFSNTEIVITTANSVYDNPVVRLVNPTTAVVNVTVSVNSSANLYSFTILGNSEIVIEKSPTNRVQGTGVFASPVAYRY